MISKRSVGISYTSRVRREGMKEQCRHAVEVLHSLSQIQTQVIVQKNVFVFGHWVPARVFYSLDRFFRVQPHLVHQISRDNVS